MPQLYTMMAVCILIVHVVAVVEVAVVVMVACVVVMSVVLMEAGGNAAVEFLNITTHAG